MKWFILVTVLASGMSEPVTMHSNQSWTTKEACEQVMNGSETQSFSTKKLQRDLAEQGIVIEIKDAHCESQDDGSI